MIPHPRAVDRKRWQPRCYITDHHHESRAVPPNLLSSGPLEVAVLVDLVLTRILFLAQTAPGRFDK